MASYEGLIDYLDDLGVIDRSRVGIIGFSRTCM
jgi:dipeptidyl aminopeptidase/acylaminoacyl peptidase